MVMAYFQVDLSVKPLSRGQAEVVPPKVLEGRDYQFIIVKEGVEEGIIQLNAPSDVMRQIEKDKQCRKLKKDEMKKLMETYPRPRIKKKYHEKTEVLKGKDEEATPIKVVDLDHNGNQIIDTVQTVRAGFYMIDVPVLQKPGEK